MLFESADLVLAYDGSVATLRLDFAGSAPNLFTPPRFLALIEALRHVPATAEMLVIASAKPAGFCAGIDTNEPIDPAAMMALGHAAAEAIASLPCITVADLRGPCFSPGLDLALACDYRFATASADTWLGFPDLARGLCSFAGGVSRLTRLVGAAAALEILTTGVVTARDARSLGLVDAAYCERVAKVERRAFLDGLKHKPRRWHSPFDGWAARRVVNAYREWMRSATPTSVAALSIIPLAAKSETLGLAAERQCVTTVDPAMIPERAEPRSVGDIAVAGPLAGVADLAFETLIRGRQVFILDADCADDLEEHFKTALERGRLTPLEADQARTRLRVNADATDMAMVLVTTDTAATMAMADAAIRPGSPIVTVNTRNTFANETITRMWRHTGSPLVEVGGHHANVVRGWLAWLGIETLAVAKTSLINRLQTAWWDEAVRLVADGLPITAVDAAARSLGAAAPLEALDGVGLDAVADRLPRVKPLLAAGIHGRPHADGFYVLHDDDSARANPVAQLVLLEAAAGVDASPSLAETIDHAAAEELCVERLTARLTVAAATELKSYPAALIDLAVVRGLGAFRRDRGILRRADTIGLSNLIDTLRTCARRFGPRFRPPSRLLRIAQRFELLHMGRDELRPLRMSA